MSMKGQGQGYIWNIYYSQTCYETTPESIYTWCSLTTPVTMSKLHFLCTNLYFTTEMNLYWGHICHACDDIIDCDIFYIRTFQKLLYIWRSVDPSLLPSWDVNKFHFATINIDLFVDWCSNTLQASHMYNFIHKLGASPWETSSMLSFHSLSLSCPQAHSGNWSDGHVRSYLAIWSVFCEFGHRFHQNPSCYPFHVWPSRKLLSSLKSCLSRTQRATGYLLYHMSISCEVGYVWGTTMQCHGE